VTLPPSELAGIGQTLAAFAHVFDDHELDLFDLVFTEDAVIELTRGAGSVKRGLAAIRSFAASLPEGGLDHHTLDTVVFVGEDGIVRARSRYLALLSDQSVHNGEYLDELAHTPAGWRITRRIAVPRIPHGERVPLSEADRRAWRPR
jgi:SnoaL-like domain